MNSSVSPGEVSALSNSWLLGVDLKFASSSLSFVIFNILGLVLGMGHF